MDLLFLFDRPLEPVFMAKGDDSSVIFDVPQSYLTNRYKEIAPQAAYSDEVEETIPVKEIVLPYLGDALRVRRDGNFSLFFPEHRRAAERLTGIFMGMRNLEELLSMACYARDRVNPYLFNYSLSVAILHRTDTKHLDIPSFLQSFPEKFIDGQTFVRAREEAFVVEDENLRIPIVIPKDYTASDLEPEHRVAYFREDLGINLHHWHWHLVYPAFGPPSVVAKNRRGELFYYMHQQILARYNTERLCNKLGRVERYIDWREPIKEGYFPKLNSEVASQGWPSRVVNMKLQNLNREADQIRADVDDLVQWKDRITAAIHSGYVLNDSGERVPLTEYEGIDILGNCIESTAISVNRFFYGDIHNMGHVFISAIHDPDGRHLEPFAVMSDTTVAMRDPIFYRWHAFIDDLFQKHKATLPRYPVSQLDFSDITVTSVGVSSANTQNVLHTFWQQSDVDMSRGLDFAPRGPLFVRFTHLQHAAFEYTISVNNNGLLQRKGTCRVFLAPRFDERGLAWLFRDLRHMFIEMDRFVVDLKRGENTITRKSTDSSVTIPFERTFRNLDLNRPQDGDELSKFNFCGCGWPHHMLVPKGTPEGFPCYLFVMVSNHEDDKVIDNISGECNDAESYCGIRNRLYPDRRSMGYPFDRQPRRRVDSLQQFLTPNMRVQEVTVQHHNRVLRPRELFRL